MIEVRNINQSYTRRGGKRSLKDVSLTIHEHKITTLVGANGAGKSTLLGVIANLIPTTSGSVLLHGQDVAHMKPQDVARQIAILKQTQHISLRITVRDLVEFGRFPHCGGRLTDEDRAKVAEAMEYMKLSDLEGRYVGELSGGQRQRAFISMILAQDTPYIFLDEPLNNLDIKYSVEMMKTIQRLVRELGKTVIVVLHDINFAAAYADHIIAMKDGRIAGEGAPDRMIRKTVLDPVFEHDFHIANHDGKSVCLYYD